MPTNKLQFCILTVIQLVIYCALDSKHGVVMCATPDEAVSQPQHSVSAVLGGAVTLECYTRAEKVTTWIWLKHTMDAGLQTMLTVYFGAEEFEREFVKRTDLRVEQDEQSCNLTIWHVQLADVASYHCAVRSYNSVHFGKGSFLLIKGSESIRLAQQPIADIVQPGDSVTLSCTIDAETCAGEHSVYWFRLGAGESQPGIIYTHADRSDQCEKSPGAGSPTQSCVYSLPKRNLSLSDAGTYYCAVATCGEILFGNGTVVEFPGNEEVLLFIGYGLTAALVACVILIFFLICFIIKGQPCQHCHGVNFQAIGNEIPNSHRSGEQNQDGDTLNYTALSFTNKIKKQRGANKMETDVVYSSLKKPDGD